MSGGTNLTSYIRTTRSEICRHRLGCEWFTVRFLWSASRTCLHPEFNSLRLIRLSQNCSSLIALYFNVNSRYFIDNLMALYQIQGFESRTKKGNNTGEMENTGEEDWIIMRLLDGTLPTAEIIICCGERWDVLVNSLRKVMVRDGLDLSQEIITFVA
jgi:hypothetical protein